MGTDSSHLPDAERIEAHPCPFCGKVNDAVTGLNGASDPGPGDVSICVYCYRVGVFGRFAGALTVRPMTAEEETAAEQDAKVGPILRKVRALADARR